MSTVQDYGTINLDDWDDQNSVKNDVLLCQAMSFLDEKGTVSKWSDPTMAGVEEINTLSKGKCLLWTTKIKATSSYPVVALYIKTPPNE